MSAPTSLAIELLADHPQIIPAVGEMRWREWGRAPEPEALDWWVNVTARESGRRQLPVTWVALDAHGQAAGAVGLAEFDIEECRDRSPWVIGMIVASERRGQGIGSRLLGELEAWAQRNGFSPLWVAASGRAVDFYRKCGWEPVETFQRVNDETTVILTKRP